MKTSLPAALCALILAGSASATAPSNYTIRITGYVPVICHATLDATAVPVASGEVSLGTLNEFCNSPNGYQVFVESSPELADASLVIDGKTVELGDEGATLISSSPHADIAARAVSLNMPEAPEGGSLSVRIVAL